MESSIKDTSYLCDKSDYDDFYLVSFQKTESQIKNSRKFIATVESYLKQTLA